MIETKNFERFYNNLGSYPSSILEINLELNKLKPEIIISDEKWLKNHELVFIYSTEVDKTLSILEIIFKCKPGFYIYFGKETKEQNYKVIILHKPTELNEVKFYINGLQKLNK